MRWLATLSVIALLLISTAGCLLWGSEEDCECHETINLGLPELSPRTVGNATVWDVEVPVHKAYPRCFQDALWWKDAWLGIRSANGTDLLPRTKMMAGPPGGEGGAEVIPWFIDQDAPSGAIGTNDTIIVESLDQSFGHGLVQVYVGKVKAGEVLLPETFPLPGG